MSNRILGILVLIVLGIFGFFYWVYIYVPGLKKIEDENIEKINTDNQQIDLIQVDDVELNLGIIEANSTEELVNSNNNSVSPEDKINNIKIDLESYKTIQIGKDKFNFIEKDNSLELFINGKIVSVFGLIPEILLNINKIYSTQGEYLIDINKEYYIYNSSADKLILLDINLNINYIKKENNLYLVKSDKGIFVYSIVSNNIEYSDIFDDFVYHNGGYVGIIKNDDFRRQKNFSIYPQNQNVIFHYNPSTKEKIILYSTNLNLTKIFHDLNQIYFEENDDNIYKLENY